MTNIVWLVYGCDESVTNLVWIISLYACVTNVWIIYLYVGISNHLMYKCNGKTMFNDRVYLTSIRFCISHKYFI
jgi:hypothetical protein